MIEVQQLAEREAPTAASTSSEQGGGGLAQLFAALLASTVLAATPEPGTVPQAPIEGSSDGTEADESEIGPREARESARPQSGVVRLLAEDDLPGIQHRQPKAEPEPGLPATARTAPEPVRSRRAMPLEGVPERAVPERLSTESFLPIAGPASSDDAGINLRAVPELVERRQPAARPPVPPNADLPARAARPVSASKTSAESVRGNSVSTTVETGSITESSRGVARSSSNPSPSQYLVQFETVLLGTAPPNPQSAAFRSPAASLRDLPPAPVVSRDRLQQASEVVDPKSLNNHQSSVDLDSESRTRPPETKQQSRGAEAVAQEPRHEPFVRPHSASVFPELVPADSTPPPASSRRGADIPGKSSVAGGSARAAQSKPFVLPQRAVPEGAFDAGRIQVETPANQPKPPDIHQVSTVFPQSKPEIVEDASSAASAARVPTGPPVAPSAAEQASHDDRLRRSAVKATDRTAAGALAVVPEATAAASRPAVAPTQEAPEPDDGEPQSRSAETNPRTERSTAAETRAVVAHKSVSTQESPAVDPTPVKSASLPAGAAIESEPILQPQAAARAAVGPPDSTVAAQVPPSPRTSETPAPVDPPSRPEAAAFRRVEAMLDARPHEPNRLQLVVHDDQLGRVSVRLVERSGLIDAMLRADQPHTARQLSDSIGNLAEALTRGRSAVDSDAGRLETARSESGRNDGRHEGRGESGREERDDASRREGERRRDEQRESQQRSARWPLRRSRPVFSLETSSKGD